MGSRLSSYQNKSNQTKIDKSNHTKIDKFIEAWQYAAIGAGLEKFSGDFTVAQRSAFTNIYNHFDKMNIMNMLYKKVKSGYVSSISLESGASVNKKGDINKYNNVFTRNDFDMFVSFTINYLLPFTDNVNITFNRARKYSEYNDDHVYQPYKITINLSDNYKMKDIVRCRDYTLTDNKLQPYRPMNWQDIKCTRDVAVFATLIRRKTKEQFNSEAKAYYKLTGNKLDSDRQPKWDCTVNEFTGLDCFDFDDNQCRDSEYYSHRQDNYNHDVKLPVC